MYLKVKYEPTTLFSLKQSGATNSAGKSLISPSPYSIKVALLNAIITFDSLATAKEHFELIRDLSIYFELPERIVANNCFIKIMKDNDKASAAERKLNPFKSTVAFREYIYLEKNISFAFETFAENEQQKLQSYNFLQKWFMHINYFGKKGCFFQFISSEIINNDDKTDYSSLLREANRNGLIFQMDDMSPKNSFEDINNYSANKPKREKKLYVFPYRQIESNKNYTFFKKINQIL